MIDIGLKYMCTCTPIPRPNEEIVIHTTERVNAGGGYASHIPTKRNKDVN